MAIDKLPVLVSKRRVVRITSDGHPYRGTYLVDDATGKEITNAIGLTPHPVGFGADGPWLGTLVLHDGASRGQFTEEVELRVGLEAGKKPDEPERRGVTATVRGPSPGPTAAPLKPNGRDIMVAGRESLQRVFEQTCGPATKARLEELERSLGIKAPTGRIPAVPDVVFGPGKCSGKSGGI